ncbi:MAG: MBL fold metallo-hydrolase RNA specificity domain-containing protein [Acidobacteriota bacterium]
MVTLTSYGAAEEVTGSRHVLETEQVRVLVDCGLFQGRREEAYEKNRRFPFRPSSLAASVNTHGHLDHCGTYPLLVKEGFSGDILSTPATRDIASLVLMDSARIQAYDARFLDKQQSRNPQPWRRVFPPLYDEEDVKAALRQYVTVAHHRPYPLAPGIMATLYDAGHILGSSLVHLEVHSDGKSLSVGFTGDLGRKGLPILRDPEGLPPLDYLVCESTYGDRLHDEIAFAEEELAQVVRNTVEAGGRVLIPAFAVERTQELIYCLHRLHDAGRIPPVPVFVDSPMAVSATAIFRAHPECYDRETVDEFLNRNESPFSFSALQYIADAEASKALNSRKGPCVIIATSGMCEAGRILHHLLHGLSDPRNTVLIVGFMAQNTLGRALADKKPEVRIFGERHPVRARVKILNAFSAHADYREIGEWVLAQDLSRLKGVFLVHGEPSAQAALARHLDGLGVRPVTALRPGVSMALT